MKANIFRKFNNPSIVLFRYFSYFTLVVFSLCILASILVYSVIFRMFNNEVNESNILKLGQVKESFDSQLLGLSQVAIKITRDYNMTHYYVLESDYSKVEAVSHLSKYIPTNGIVNNIALYYFTDETDLVFLSDGTLKKQYFSSAHDLTGEELETAAQGYLPTMLAKPKSKYLYYVFPLPYNKGFAQGALIFILDKAEMIARLQNGYKNYKTNVFIYSNDGTLLLSSVNDDKSNLKESNILEMFTKHKNETGVFDVNINQGTPLTVVKLKSEYFYWDYVVFIEQREFKTSILKFRQVLDIIITGMALIGLILSGLLAFRAYRPIKNVADKIRGSDSPNLPKQTRFGNELLDISHAFELTNTENKRLLGEIHSQSHIIRDQLIMSVLKGEMDDFRKLGGFNFCSERFIVICLLIDRTFKLGEGINAVKNAAKTELDNCCPDGFVQYTVNSFDTGYVVSLLNLSADAPSFDATTYVRRVQERVTESSGATITAGIGREITGFGKIQASFKQAKYASEYRMIYGWGSIIRYDDLIGVNEFKDAQFLSDDNIISTFKQLSMTKLTMLIDFALPEKTGSITPEAVKNEYYKFLRIIKHVVSLADGLCDDISSDVDRATDLPFETIAQARETLLGLAAQYCERLLAAKESKNTSVKDNVITYLEKNYADSSITLEKIAEHVKLSPSYLSRYFKDQTGETVFTYLDGIRLAKAKELLTDTDLTVKEIVIIVGYVDVNNFIRKFKRMMGITPLNFRNTFKKI